MPATLLRLFAIVALFFCLGALPSVRASAEGEELRAADAELNTSFQKAMGALPTAAAKAKLREAQRAWVAFRDAEVALHAEIPGASGNVLKMLQTELTEARTKQLKAIAEEAK